MPPSILLTIDVEDWFQVENFKQYIPFSTWSSYEFRVEKNTHHLLDLFDSYNPQPATHNRHTHKLRCTFFILGWLAERLPHLVREIQERGHEVASHGFHHNLCNEESSHSLKQDLLDSKKLLEDTISAPVLGFRAPSFSISDDISKKGLSYQVSNNFYELPISNLTLYKKDRLLKNADFCSSSRKKRILTTDIQEVFRGLKSDSDAEIGEKAAFFKGFTLPWGGGAYFRIIPFSIFKLGVGNILKKENAYLFYMHPWEIDPDQPRVCKASSSSKFRHYINLKNTFSKLTRFIEYFGQCRFVSCRLHLNKVADS